MNRDVASRVAIGVGIALAWGSLWRMFLADGIRHPRGLSAWIDLSFLVNPVAAVAATLVFLGLLVQFSRRKAPVVTASAMAAMLALGAHIQASQRPGNINENHSVVMPGAMLVAWALGAWWARRRGGGDAEQDHVGYEAACGVVGAAYTMAGVHKVIGSGWAWATPTNLQAHILIHAPDGLPALLPFRLALAEIPWLTGFFGVGTLLIECSFFLFAVPKLRVPWAVFVACMHIGIGVILDLHHYDYMLIALGMAFYRPRSD